MFSEGNSVGVRPRLMSTDHNGQLQPIYCMWADCRLGFRNANILVNKKIGYSGTNISRTLSASELLFDN